MDGKVRKNAELADDQRFDGKRSAQMGKFFHDRRVAAGISIDNASAALNLPDPSVLEDYETGKVQIPLEDVFTLTNYLNIAPEEILAMFNSFFVAREY